MSDKTNDGGPAFPLFCGKGDVSTGMSLRAYFAGEAMKGLCANPELARRETVTIEHFGTVGVDQFYANLSVRRADALIKELEK